MLKKTINIKHRALWLIICYLLFLALYSLSGSLASVSDNVKWYVFDWEGQLSFVPVMIVPYMSSGILFCVIFFICKNRNEFDIMINRIVLITILATLIHILFPLTNTFIKPEVSSSILSPMFNFIKMYDTAFNQLPSLHVCYAVIYWTVIGWCVEIKWVRNLLKMWIVLIILSTLFVFQHHIIDVITALTLGCVVNIVFNRGRNSVIGNLYMFMACLLICGFILNFKLMPLLWAAIALIVVGNAYLNNNPRFLKQSNGRLKKYMVIPLAPYIIFYIVSRYLMRDRRRDVVKEIYPNVYVGALLTSNQAKRLFPDGNVIVFDHSAELPENSFLRNNTLEYKFRPALDISQFDADKIADEIVDCYINSKNKLFIHCTMGYSRSVAIANLTIVKYENRIL